MAYFEDVEEEKDDQRGKDDPREKDDLEERDHYGRNEMKSEEGKSAK